MRLEFWIFKNKEVIQYCALHSSFFVGFYISSLLIFHGGGPFYCYSGASVEIDTQKGEIKIHQEMFILNHPLFFFTLLMLLFSEWVRDCEQYDHKNNHQHIHNTISTTTASKCWLMLSSWSCIAFFNSDHIQLTF